MSELCHACGTPLSEEFVFCSECGAPVPQMGHATEVTQLASYLQIVRGPAEVRGSGLQLAGESTRLGSAMRAIDLSSDPFACPEHAEVSFVKGTEYLLKDLDSENGTYVGIRREVSLASGDIFLAGNQVLRVDLLEDAPVAGTEGERYQTSVHPLGPFQVTRILAGGLDGRTVTARGSSLLIGRYNCDLSFADDLYLSGTHCEVRMGTDGLVLEDKGSRNGTFVRLEDEQGHALEVGDQFFVGRALFRFQRGQLAQS